VRRRGGRRGPERKERHFRPINTVKGRANRAQEANYSRNSVSQSSLRNIPVSRSALFAHGTSAGKARNVSRTGDDRSLNLTWSARDRRAWCARCAWSKVPRNCWPCPADVLSRLAPARERPASPATAAVPTTRRVLSLYLRWNTKRHAFRRYKSAEVRVINNDDKHDGMAGCWVYKLISCFPFRAFTTPSVQERQLLINATINDVRSSIMKGAIVSWLKLFVINFINKSWTLWESKKFICTPDDSSIARDQCISARVENGKSEAGTAGICSSPKNIIENQPLSRVFFCLR